MENKDALGVAGMKKHKIIKIKSKWDNLIVFDFDDTLAHTDEATLVRDKKSKRIVDHLYGQEEFDNHTLDDKHFYDFKEFHGVSEFAEPIKITIDLMKEFIDEPSNKVIILTARQPEAQDAVLNYLSSHGIDRRSISYFGVDGSKNKARWLKKLIKRFSITKSITVFEDNVANIQSMIPLEYQFPDLKFDFVQVIDPTRCDDLEEAKKFRYPKGKYATEPYQRILKRVHPTMKRRLLGMGANNYLVKGAKKVKDFKRSKSAPPGG